MIPTRINKARENDLPPPLALPLYRRSNVQAQASSFKPQALKKMPQDHPSEYRNPNDAICLESRTTRSKKVFSPWSIFRVERSNPDFDLDQVLKKKIAEENSNPEQEAEDPVELEGEELEKTASLVETVEEGNTSGGMSDSDNDDDFDASSVASSESVQSPPSKPSISLPTNSQLPQKPQTHHRKRRNQASHKARAQKRAKPDFETSKPRKSVRKRYETPGPSVKCTTPLDGKSVTSTGFVGMRETDKDQTAHPLSYFVGPESKLNFTHESWNGKAPMALLDKNSRLIGVLAGHPDADDWPEVHREAARALESARLQRQSHCSDPSRRGEFVTLRCGVSHGGGQTSPRNLHNDAEATRLTDELNQMPCFERMASFSSSVMATRMPRLHKYYARKMGKLYRHDKTLKRPFQRCVHSAVSYNCGPRTVCYKHCDCGNLAFGMCSITALGEFNHELGGHLVLWPLRLVIDFPPGSTILIPSAIVAHSNTTIGPDERRYSFAQYTSGSLFRWVDNKFQKATTYRNSLTSEELKKVQKADSRRWKKGLAMLPIVKGE